MGSKPMIEISEEDLKKKENHYIQLAEDGEPILVTKPDGNKYLMVPQKPDDMRHLWDHDDGA
tara:strand:+ start:847 stop:1032 length:186 start_codon:yes stop_codon:yes gene_type:complete